MNEIQSVEFTFYTGNEFNKKYGTGINDHMGIIEMTDHIEENDLSYFYASYNEEDIISAIEEEWEVAENLKIDYVNIDGVYMAIY